MSESEVTNAVLSHHQNMLTVLKIRERNLRLVYSLWQSKDLKVSEIYCVLINAYITTIYKELFIKYLKLSF